MDIVTVRILKWEKHNYRKDVKSASWFRLNHLLFIDAQFCDFNHADFCFWIYLLCLASMKSSGTIVLNYSHAQRMGKFSKAEITSALQKLQLIQCVHVDDTFALRERDEGVTSTGSTDRQKDRQTDVSSELENPNSRAHEDFVSLKEVIESRKIKYETQCSWREAFPDAPWIIQEVRKAIAWESSNPKRKKKDFSRFMTNWLMRNWDQRKLPSLGSPSGQSQALSPETQKKIEYYQSLRKAL